MTEHGPAPRRGRPHGSRRARRLRRILIALAVLGTALALLFIASMALVFFSGRTARAPLEEVEPPCVMACVESRRAALDPRRMVTLLVRSFLLPGEREPRELAYHLYLFFSEDGPDTLPSREAASLGVLGIFDVRQVLARGMAPSKLAALHIPIHEDHARAIARAETELERRGYRDQKPAVQAQLLIEGYDYLRARQLKREIEAATGTALPRVAILAHPHPLSDLKDFDRSRFLVVDLERLSPDQVRAHVNELRDRVESATSGILVDGPVEQDAVDYLIRTNAAIRDYRGE